jgi:hypothetical protein
MAVASCVAEALKSVVLKYVDLLQMVQAAPIETLVPPSTLREEVRASSTQLSAQMREHLKQASALRNLIRLWGKEARGILLVDEIDLVLHPLKSELNFPIGPWKALHMGEQRWGLPFHLIDAVFFASRGRLSMPDLRVSADMEALLASIRAAIHDGIAACAMQAIPHVVLLDEEYYVARLRGLMARWALVWVLAQPSMAPHRGLSAAALEAFVCGTASAAVAADINAAVGVGEAAAVLNITRDWITTYLPHVLSKIDRVSFGMLSADDIEKWPQMPKSRRLLAVPFLGKDVPSRASEFAQPDVLIGLTILAYRYEGLRMSDLTIIMTKLRDNFSHEAGVADVRPSRQRFDDFVARARACADVPDSAKSLEVLPLELFQISEKLQMERLFKLLHRSPEVILYYLCTHVFPSVMHHQHTKLTASGVDLGSDMLFHLRLGFSGTPSDLIPLDLKPCHHEPGSDATIVRVLTAPQHVSVHRVSSWSVNALLQWVANPGTGRPFTALIDVGALVTGMTNEEVARCAVVSSLHTHVAFASGVIAP